MPEALAYDLECNYIYVRGSELQEGIVGEGTKIELQEHLGSLAVSGKGMKGRKGISGDIQSTLADAGVNLTFIEQGSKERCIIYGINACDGPIAVNAIYDRYLR